MCWQDQTLLSHPCCTSNTCKNDVSSKIAFARGFDDEPGSNVMSFSHHVLKHYDSQKAYGLAVWLMTQQTS